MVDLPIKEGLFKIAETKGESPRLLGARCKVCGYVCFPAKPVCVRCVEENTMTEVELGPYGTLETFAVMQVGPPEFPPPYMVAYVRSNEGALIFSIVSGCPVREDSLEIGQAMELVIEPVKQDSRGNNLLGWKFKPAERGDQ